MSESRPGHLSTAGSWQENEEQAQRLWTASARRAAISVKHRRHIAAEIYWRSAFDIALSNLERTGAGLFSPLHVLEPLQGLVNLLLEQGKWMAARSLYAEVADFLTRKGFALTGLAERVLNATAQRIAHAQKENTAAASAPDNVEDMLMSASSSGRLRRQSPLEPRRTATSSGSVG
jgi:hypothetical protein